MKSTRFLQLGLFTLLAASASWLHAQPGLNGLAVNTEFGKERFIAALYADQPSSNAEDILSSSGERRMELKVTADSLSARSVNSMWVEGMAINNPPSALEAQAENLARLNNMVRKRLRAGDVLTFTAIEGEGTTVVLNGVQLGVIRSDDFFPMLLRTWIGSIPLSSDFKDALLAAGDVDAGLSARYAAIAPSAARAEAVAGWVAPEPPAPQIADAGLAPPKPEVAVAPPPPVTTAPEPAPEPEPEPEPQVAATPAPAEPKPTPPAQVAKAPPAPAPVEEDEDEDELEVMVTAESLLLRQHYISDVMRKTLQNMRYPRRAQERSQEGSIRLAVTVSRDGEVRDVKIVEESRYSLLNKEAVDSVERANPFPALPAGIAGESFAFGIPITFRLQ